MIAARYASLLAFAQSRGSDCGREPDGKFGGGNKCAVVGGVLRPKSAEPHEQEPSFSDKDDDHVYHVTTQGNAASILSEGFKQSGSTVKGGAYETYSKGKLFFTEKSGLATWKGKIEDHLFHEHDDPPPVAIVRVKKSEVEHLLKPDEIGTKDAGSKAYYVDLTGKKKEGRAFCPTGEGGGVKNDCSAKDSQPSDSSSQHIPKPSWMGKTDASGSTKHGSWFLERNTKQHESPGHGDVTTHVVSLVGDEGQVKAFAHADLSDDKNNLYMNYAHVAEPYRRQGVYTSLLDSLSEKFRVTSDESHNVASYAKKAYERLGARLDRYDHYVLEKKKKSEDRAFCPTGVGGGVKNDCSSSDGGQSAKSFPEGSQKLRDAVDSVATAPEQIWDRSRGLAETPAPKEMDDIANEQTSYSGAALTPEAEASYGSLVDEIGRQYEALTAAGLKARAWHGEGEPYGDPPGSTKPNSNKMREEVAKTGEFSFFMTDKGFGTGDATPNHPMLRETKYKTADGEPMIANDLFRVVHDMVAHVRGGYSFSTNGEYNGMLTHASTLPEEAWPALFAETFGQNAVYEKTKNYAPQNAYASKVGPEIIRSELKKRNKSSRAAKDDGDEPLGYQHLKSRPALLKSLVEERGFCPNGKGGGVTNTCGKGIGVNDSEQDFTGQILAGEKTIETRPTNSLKSYIGKTVGIVRTGKGKATLVGVMKVGEPKFYKTRKEFDADFDKHRVGKDSGHYIGPEGKYGYPLSEVKPVKPRTLDSKGYVARVIAKKVRTRELTVEFDLGGESPEEPRESRGDAPAPPKDRIKGSDVNDEGSAKNKSGDISLDEGTISALKSKAEEHNAAMREGNKPEWTHVRLPALKAVYRRGAGAFSVSHRPGMTRDRWAMARVNAFLALARRGRPENSKYVTDNDLLHSKHPKYSVQARAFCATGEGGGVDNSCGAKTMSAPDKDGGGSSTASSAVISNATAGKVTDNATIDASDEDADANISTINWEAAESVGRDSPDIEKAIYRYSVGPHEVNGYFRYGESLDEYADNLGSTPESLALVAAATESAIKAIAAAANPEASELTSFRGLMNLKRNKEYFDAIKSVSVGDVIKEAGVFSTSASLRRAAMGFTSQDGGVIFRVKGKSGAPIAKIANRRDEWEVAYPNRSHFVVTAVARNVTVRIPSFHVLSGKTHSLKNVTFIDIREAE